jgi:hypothetical protein
LANSIKIGYNDFRKTNISDFLDTEILVDYNDHPIGGRLRNSEVVVNQG